MDLRTTLLKRQPMLTTVFIELFLFTVLYTYCYTKLLFTLAHQVSLKHDGQLGLAHRLVQKMTDKTITARR